MERITLGHVLCAAQRDDSPQFPLQVLQNDPNALLWNFLHDCIRHRAYNSNGFLAIIPNLTIRASKSFFLARARSFFSGDRGKRLGCVHLQSSELFGVASIKAQLSGKPVRPPEFIVRGPYLWVRHPLYFFVIVMIWSCPDLAVDRLLFNVLWTMWIYLGTFLEERDLLADFGEAYREYQSRVPRLIP